MASTSRSLFLLSLLVSCLCMTATASRSLQETDKVLLSVGGLDLDLVKLLNDKQGLINLSLTLDLLELLHPVEIFVKNAAGKLVKLVDAVAGSVTEVGKPTEVKVAADGTVNLVVKVLGKGVPVAVKLSELDPVLETVGGVVHVVLKLVEKVVDGVTVVAIVDLVGNILVSVTLVL